MPAPTFKSKIPRPPRPEQQGTKPPGGSRKGIPNRTTTAAKETILEAFDLLQFVAEEGYTVRGRDAFVYWASRNPGEFYTKIYTKVLPLDVKASGTVDMVVQVVRFSESEGGE